MPTVLDKSTPTPDLIGTLGTRRRDPLELDAAITALVDREELAGPDEAARLRRIRGDLETELADRLAE